MTIELDGRITKKAPYGQHIALRCKVHKDATYSTKNILYIGARTIFPDDIDCPCQGSSSLEPVPVDGPDVPA